MNKSHPLFLKFLFPVSCTALMIALLSTVYLGDQLEIETTDLSTGETTIEYMIDSPEDAFFPFSPGSTGTLFEEDFDDIIYNPNKIIGDDDRTIIEDTTKIPYRYIGLLVAYCLDESTGVKSRAISTGFLVGEKLVLTAAHCVYPKDLTVKNIYFYPAKNGTTQKFGYYEVKNTHVPTKFKSAVAEAPSKEAYTPEMQKYDYALLELDYNIGATLGYFGLGGYNTVYNNTTLVGKKVTVAGYPKERGNKLYRHKEKILEFDSAGIIMKYQIDVEHGQSGSPVIYPINGNYYVVGIHVSESKNFDYNSGRYITKNIYQLVKKYSSN